MAQPIFLFALDIFRADMTSVPQDFTAPVPITPLSQEFLRQGERHLGVSAAQLAAIAKQKRRPRNEDGDSDQEDAGTGD